MTPLSTVVPRERPSFFYRPTQVVSRPASLTACIPSISCTASWTGIRRQIPRVISEQQRGCYTVQTMGLCASYVDYKGAPPTTSREPSPARFCPVFSGWNIGQASGWFMSPQAYLQSLAPYNVFQSIKGRKGALCTCSLFVLQPQPLLKSLQCLH